MNSTKRPSSTTTLNAILRDVQRYDDYQERIAARLAPFAPSQQKQDLLDALARNAPKRAILAAAVVWSVHTT
jgi:hypothetical protein